MVAIAKAQRLALGLSALALVLSACASSSVDIRSARVSIDEMRLDLALTSCNASLELEIDESEDLIGILVVDTDAPMFRLGGDDCEDHLIVDLDRPLGDRVVVDVSSGTSITPNRTDLPPEYWPFDGTRFSNEEWAAALDQALACVRVSTPDAYLERGLNWDTPSWWYFARTEATNRCDWEHLAPLLRVPVQSEIGEGWRFLAIVDGGAPDRRPVIVGGANGLEVLWGTLEMSYAPPDVDFAEDVVIAFPVSVTAACPDPVMEIHFADQAVVASIGYGPPQLEIDCGPEDGVKTLIFALDRSYLPPAPFTVATDESLQGGIVIAEDLRQPNTLVES